MKKFICLLGLYSALASAAEVDNFRYRYEPLKDEKETINRWANEEFKSALQKANHNKKHCSEAALFHSLKRSFKNHYRDRFTSRLYKGNGLVERRIPFNSSIYREFAPGDSFVIGVMAKFSDSAAPVVNFNGHLIGTDKFEHLFGRGLAYYTMIHKEGKSLLDALKYGFSTEENILGAMMTGVMSYGDLSGNFRGLFFWNHVLMKYADPLEFERPAGAYASCEDGKWVQKTPIDLSLYIDNALDESINCSKFRTQEQAEKVADIQRLYQEEDPAHTYTCPVLPEEAASLYTKYGEYAPWVINNGQVYLK